MDKENNDAISNLYNVVRSKSIDNNVDKLCKCHISRNLKNKYYNVLPDGLHAEIDEV